MLSAVIVIRLQDSSTATSWQQSLQLLLSPSVQKNAAFRLVVIRTRYQRLTAYTHEGLPAYVYAQLVAQEHQS